MGMSDYKVVVRLTSDATSPDNQTKWSPGCPIMLEAIQISRNTATGRAFLQARVRNISTSEVESFKAKLQCTFSDGSTDQFEVNPLDADVSPWRDYTLPPIELPRGDAISADAAIVSTCYAGGTNIACDKPASLPFRSKLELSETALKERTAQLAEIGCTKAEAAAPYRTDEHESWTLCSCGQVSLGYKTCPSCGLPFGRHGEIEDCAILERGANERARLLREKKEADAKRTARKRLWARKTCAVILSVAAVGGAGFFAYENLIFPAGRYDEAVRLAQSGQYLNAVKIFEELGTYRDSSQQAQSFRAQWQEKTIADNYAKAIDLLESGEAEEALTLFGGHSEYEDTPYYMGECLIALNRFDEAIEHLQAVSPNSELASDAKEAQKQCYYEKGVADLENGNIFAARENFSNANDYGNAPDALAVISKHIDNGLPGIYQREDDSEEFIEILCAIDPNTLEASYEVYYQNSVVEDLYTGSELRKDGSLLLIDTCDNTLTTANHSTSLIAESSHHFQPDESVYSAGGTKGYGGAGSSRQKIILQVNGTKLVESYRYAGKDVWGKQFDNSGTHTYQRIGEIEQMA